MSDGYWCHNEGMENRLQEVINRLLQREKINQSELARACGLPVNTIQRLCSGETPDPRMSTLRGVAKFFGVSISQLIGDSPIPGLDPDYTGDFTLPYPKSHEVVGLYRLISQEDKAGRINGPLARNIQNLIQSVLDTLPPGRGPL